MIMLGIVLLKMAISQSSNVRERTGVLGALLLLIVISPASNGGGENGCPEYDSENEYDYYEYESECDWDKFRMGFHQQLRKFCRVSPPKEREAKGDEKAKGNAPPRPTSVKKCSYSTPQHNQ